MTTTQESLSSCLAQLYPRPCVRGQRIARLEETRLGPFELTAESAFELGRNNIGVFVGSCGGLGRAMNLLRALDRADSGGRWIVITATKKMNAVLFAEWQLQRTSFIPLNRVPTYWTASQLIFAPPEGLGKIDNRELLKDPGVAGLILLDMQCFVHKARSMTTRYNFKVQNDRPQLIANFRSRLCREGWLPPLMFWTEKPAKSVWTTDMLSPYCLDAWWFVDGQSLSCSQREEGHL